MLGLCFATLSSAMANDQLQIIKQVREISYGTALTKFCPFNVAQDYIRFTENLIRAERLIKFEHAGAYKLIKKHQEVLAKQATNFGKKCNKNIAETISQTELLLNQFRINSSLNDEMVANHPKNPKPNQAFIFASYLQARQAWYYERQCHNLSELARQEFFKLMKKTQYDLEHFFRPGQIAGLNKRRKEGQISAIPKDCKKLTDFTEYAIRVMSEDIPNALIILKNI